MKITVQLAILSVTACLTGCTSPNGYLVDRGRDAADVFTAAIGTGAGVKIRVGPVQAGLMANNDLEGLRCGRIGPLGSFGDYMDTVTPFPYKVSERSRYFLDKEYPWRYPRYAFGDDYFMGSDRGKNYAAVSPFPFLSLAGQPEYYSQVEVVVAAFVSIRLGLNPGELLDFLLGWSTLDVYGDDIGLVEEADEPA